MSTIAQFGLGDLTLALHQDGPTTPELADTLLRMVSERGMTIHNRLVEQCGDAAKLSPEQVEELLEMAKQDDD